MRETGRCGAIGVIRNVEGRYLVIERSSTVRAPGRYCFPGGGIEPGETEGEAVVRELREELQIDVLPIRRWWQSYTPSGVQLFWWLVDASTAGEPTANPIEVARWFWMSAAEIIRHPMTLKTNREFLAAVKGGNIDMIPPDF